MGCSYLKEFLQTEIEIIEKNIDLHKWYNHIESKDLAIEHFILQYAWLMRQYYCGYICIARSGCSLSEQYKNPKE